MFLGALALPHPPLIRPEVGRGEEKKIQKTVDAYREAVALAAGWKPETVVVVSPHGVSYADYFHISPGKTAKGDLARFRAESVKVSCQYDRPFVNALCDLARKAELPAGTLGEKDPALDHGTVLPLSFLNEVYTDYKLVRVGLSGLSPAAHYGLGRCIRDAALALDRRVLLIASGDLSHKLTPDGPYGFAPEGPKFDAYVAKAFAEGDFLSLLDCPPELSEGAAECGLRAFQIMAGAFDGTGVKSRLLSYEGPFGVGYGVAVFTPAGPDPARETGRQYEALVRERAKARKAAEDPFVRLARHSLEAFVKTGRPAALPSDLPQELASRRAGAFVSLKVNGRLRGCIGTISPVTGSLGEEIMRNAVSACSQDPRFDPVTPGELDTLTISVDVLGEAEEIEDMSQLDPKRYGVIVQRGSRRGLLLPDLAGVDSPREQVRIAKQKAGIADFEDVTLYRFEVVRHL